jgi:hypothetical protein
MANGNIDEQEQRLMTPCALIIWRYEYDDVHHVLSINILVYWCEWYVRENDFNKLLSYSQFLQSYAQRGFWENKKECFVTACQILKASIYIGI